MKNPLSSQYSEEEHTVLLKQVLAGSKDALNTLIHLHQPFIYNVAWKMTHNPDDAKDLTQEVLIKVITKLSQFQFKSKFRSWLYRIVTNEFLNTRRRSVENKSVSFDMVKDRLNSLPDYQLTAEEEIEQKEISKEMQIRCMSGMLMCLTREQRLIYILGDTFGVNHNLGAEIFQISPQNFRVRLHRARKELYNFMNNQCGLVNKNNPCRCPKKARALLKKGVLDKKNLQFNISHKYKIADYVEEHLDEHVELVEKKYTELFRNHATKEDFDKETIISKILNDEKLMQHFQFLN